MQNEVKEEKVNIEEKKETKPKSNLVLIIVLIGIILGLSGYIVYDKCISKEDNNNIEEKENQIQNEEENDENVENTEKNIEKLELPTVTGYITENIEPGNRLEVEDLKKLNTVIQIVKSAGEDWKMKTKVKESDIFVGDYFTSLRNDNNYTQSQLCDILGISRSAYSRYENGSRAMPSVW